MSSSMLERAAQSTHPSTRRTARMLRAAEVAQRLDLPVKRVRILAQQGIIPRVKIGHSIRFNEAELEEWIAAGGAGYPGATE